LLQYFTMLREVASAPSTKIVAPLEVFRLLKPLEEHLERATKTVSRER
jgi:hypothetical protein